jgi:hypothetical protein
MTCQKFCSVFGSNLIKHIFTSMSREGISFCIVPPSCFASVYPLNFLQVYTLGKAIGWGACLVSPYFGNDLNLGLYPTLKQTISLQFEAHGPEVPHQTWKYDMLEIHEFSSHAIVHIQVPSTYPLGVSRWKMEKRSAGGFQKLEHPIWQT